MKALTQKILFIMLLIVFSALSVFAEAIQDQPLTKEFLNKDIKIIDIRTEGEWKQSGIVKDSYTIMFFDENRRSHGKEFMAELNKIVKKDETFAIVCRTGNRTSMAKKFLNMYGYENVVDLTGGLVQAVKNGVKLYPYGKH